MAQSSGAAAASGKQEIEYACTVRGCNKKYTKYPSLYTHVKTKHPETPFHLIMPKQRDQNLRNQIEPHRLNSTVDLALASLFANESFLNFFKIIKDEDILEDVSKPTHSEYYNSEKHAATALDDALLAQGDAALLFNLSRAKALYERRTRPNDAPAALIHHCQQKSRHVPNSHPVNVLLNVSFKKNEDAPPAPPAGAQYVVDAYRPVTTPPAVAAGSPEDENLANFFIIAREVVKPLRPAFALEICYLFDRVIECAPRLRNMQVQTFQLTIQKEL